MGYKFDFAPRRALRRRTYGRPAARTSRQNGGSAMTRRQSWRWLVLIVAIVTAGARGAAAARARQAAPAAAPAHAAGYGAAAGKSGGWIKGSVMCSEVDDFDHA